MLTCHNNLAVCASPRRAQTTTNKRKAIMTDPPIDDTEAREQDAPGTTDAKHRAPVHGHTGDVPSDKALSDSCRGLVYLSVAFGCA
eukprot:scaffold49_cov115-Isochrysis_galbana.AAC.7